MIKRKIHSQKVFYRFSSIIVNFLSKNSICIYTKLICSNIDSAVANAHNGDGVAEHVVWVVVVALLQGAVVVALCCCYSLDCNCIVADTVVAVVALKYCCTAVVLLLLLTVVAVVVAMVE